MITVKEEFLASAKCQRAIRVGGWQALGLWLALKGYCAEHLTDGFVPDEVLDALPGAPPKPRKVLRALVECGLLEPDGTRGAGLVDVVPNGVQLHAYLDHAESRERVLQKRQLAKERKDRWRQNASGTRSDSVPERIPDASGTRPRARVRADVPSPAQPSPTRDPDLVAAAEDLTGMGEPTTPAAAAKVPCPADLALTADQQAQLVTALIPEAAITALTLEFVAKSVGDPSDVRPLTAWRKCLAKAIAGEWNRRGSAVLSTWPRGGSSRADTQFSRQMDRVAQLEREDLEEHDAAS